MKIDFSVQGKRFSRLTALAWTGRVNSKHVWFCKCDCGTELFVRETNLKSGNSKSCGCLLSETSRRIGHENATHGLSDTREYRSWSRMIHRCYFTTDNRYKYYGGRGITVCQRWIDRFENFLADMGPKPTPRHTIDRIDNDGDYEPGNCRWATYAQQNRNRRPYVHRNQWSRGGRK